MKKSDAYLYLLLCAVSPQKVGVDGSLQLPVFIALSNVRLFAITFNPCSTSHSQKSH